MPPMVCCCLFLPLMLKFYLNLNLNLLAQIIDEIRTLWRFELYLNLDKKILRMSDFDLPTALKVEEQINAQAFFISRIIETSPDMIHIVNMRTGTTVYVNKMLLSELGYSKEDVRIKQLDKSFKDLYHPDDLAVFEQFNREIEQASDDATPEVEVRIKAKDGTWQWIRTRAKVFQRDEDGKPLKYIGFAQVITDIKKAAEEKKQLALLTELNKTKTDFFNNVSHEFRTPLSLILSPIQNILERRGNLNAEQIQKLEMVQRNALRLQRLVNTQLDYARIEAGRMEAIFQPTDLKKLTEDVASTFRSLIEQAGLKFNVKCEALEEPIYVSHEMWETIVLNLLSNAFKYTFEGRINVLLRVNKNHVQLHVSDTGVGIKAENLPKIFDRFAKVEASRSRTHEGSGIGLALVRELVNIHGGTIKVTSEPEQGSTFIVIIPKGKSHLRQRQIHEFTDNAGVTPTASSFVQQATAWLADQKSTRRKSNRNNAAQTRPDAYTVLLVDDNLDLRVYIEDLLSDECKVIGVQNSKQAMEVLASQVNIDLVILDVMLPQTSGTEFVKTIRQNYSNIPVVMLSAINNETMKQSALKNGANDYIEKPFVSSALKSRIIMHLEKKQQRSK
jgi:PAS domain S-box-containing protein